MTIIKQIEAKIKTEKVINSCKTNEHFEVARRMVELYYKKFEDLLGYSELNRLIKKNNND
jgi:hypothetical protein